MKIEDKVLNEIEGGTVSLATWLNAVTNIIKVLFDAGEGLGSSIRRLGDNNICK